jgi:L-ascorbate metabolism protein UlaG (beta-lactamase superfamily)
MQQAPPDPSSPARRRLIRLAAALPLGALGARGAAAAPAAPVVERPWHHLPDGTFRNPRGSPGRGGTVGEWLAFSWRRVGNPPPAPDVPPGHVLAAEEAAAGLAAATASGGDSVTWLGHACFLVRLGGRTILTDPYLSEYASPFQGFGPKRYAGPALPPERLPPVDVLLLSHNHYDHLDLATLPRLPGVASATAVMPLGLGRYLGSVGPGRRLELDWLQRVEVGGIGVTATPAIHFSKRGLFDRNASLWCGFHLEAGGRRVLFTGDTGYGPVFPEVGARLPAPDLALVPIGAYKPEHMMQGSHCTPEEGVAIGRDFGARRLCAMHWGVIQLTDEYPFEPPGRFRAAAAKAGYAEADAWALAIGETRAF